MSNWEVVVTFVLGTFYGSFIMPLIGKLLIYWASQIEVKK